MPVKTVQRVNIKTRSLKAGANIVLEDNIKIRSDKVGANTVVEVIIRIKMYNQGVNHALLDNIKIKIDSMDANTVVKVIIKTKLDNRDVKHAVMVRILTRMPDLDVKAVEDFIVGTNGLRPQLLIHLTSIHVTSTNHVHGKVTGREIVGRRAMHKADQAVGMVIIIESVAIISRIISMSLIGGQVIMQQVIPSVTLHQREGLD